VIGKNKDVVQVGGTEIEPPQNVFHEALKCLGVFEQAEGEELELE
jgi:hypothetical protein